MNKLSILCEKYLSKVVSGLITDAYYRRISENYYRRVRRFIRNFSAIHLIYLKFISYYIRLKNIISIILIVNLSQKTMFIMNMDTI
ncbi:hypothetical protein ES705_50990 [subsurface metagenome]